EVLEARAEGEGLAGRRAGAVVIAGAETGARERGDQWELEENDAVLAAQDLEAPLSRGDRFVPLAGLDECLGEGAAPIHTVDRAGDALAELDHARGEAEPGAGLAGAHGRVRVEPEVQRGHLAVVMLERQARRPLEGRARLGELAGEHEAQAGGAHQGEVGAEPNPIGAEMDVTPGERRAALAGAEQL